MTPERNAVVYAKQEKLPVIIDLMRRRGYKVNWVDSFAVAEAMLIEGECDALLVDTSVSDDDLTQALSLHVRVDPSALLIVLGDHDDIPRTYDRSVLLRLLGAKFVVLDPETGGLFEGGVEEGVGRYAPHLDPHFPPFTQAIKQLKEARIREARKNRR